MSILNKFIILIQKFIIINGLSISVSIFNNNDDVFFLNQGETCIHSRNYNQKNIQRNKDSYHNFLTSYYDNLKTNFGCNYKGSCGYVAIGMLLSYYDTYLNDNIIPEKYDAISNGYESDMTKRSNSPGIMKDVIIKPGVQNYATNLSPDNYYKEIEKITEISLHAKLIQLGYERGYYKIGNFKFPCGTFFNERLVIISDYFAKCTNYKKDIHYNLDFCRKYFFDNNEKVRNFAINQIINGKPVLLSYSYDDESHACIAYDYDSKTDKLYIHKGWHNYPTNVTLDNIINIQYEDALTINFNIQHSHSNNYAVTSFINNNPVINTYCYHDCSIYTQNSYITHNSYYEYFEQFSQSKHKSFCKCGEYILSPHAIKAGSTYIVDGHTFAKCIDCNEEVNLDNNIVFIKSSNAIKRSKNGSYILSNGMFVIVDEDINEYINGTLKFY